MKILIIGGVAAGCKVAAKLKRLNRSWDVKIITMGKDISYAGCGLPYYVGELIKEESDLIVNTKEKFYNLTGVSVETRVMANKVNFNKKEVYAVDLNTNENRVYSYDKLVIATGASPIVPPLEGINLDGIYNVRTPDDAINIRKYIKDNNVKSSVVVGASFIGLEMAENLMELGIKVTVIDMMDQVLPNVFDKDFSHIIRKRLEEKGLVIKTSTKVLKFNGNTKVNSVKTEKEEINTDLVILSIGIKPNTSFLDSNEIALEKGRILVNEKLETSVKDVYAVGDCIMTYNKITGLNQYAPMGSSANLEGRILARIINGEDVKFKGVLGTGVIKLIGFNAGRCGLNESNLKDLNIEYEAVTIVCDDKAHYYPGSNPFIIKLIARRDNHQILGCQVIGEGNIDKIVDICVACINLKGTLEDFEDSDFSYAPPFSTAINPFSTACNVLLNKLNGVIDSMTPLEYLEGKAEKEGYIVVDANVNPTIKNTIHVDLTKINGKVDNLDKNSKYLLVCQRGKRAYLVQNRLKYYGYKNTLVLEGSTTVNDVK